MRKLMWFAIGFGAACAAGVYWLSGPWLLLLALFVLIAAVALGFLKSKASRLAVFVLAGCVAGLVWLFGYDWLYLADARALDDKTAELSIQVS